MYQVIKNGIRWREYADYGAACAAVRLDAIKHRLSDYSIWDAATAQSATRRSTDKPLYRVTCGMTYEAQKAAA